MKCILEVYRRCTPSRGARVQLAAAIAAGLMSVSASHAAPVVTYDDISPSEVDATVPEYYTDGVASEFVGQALTLTAGTQDITGFDTLVCNFSDVNVPNLAVNIFVFGGTHAGGNSPTNPAFSNELAEITLTLPTINLAAGYYLDFEATNPGTAPAISLSTPLVLPSGGSIGLTFNCQTSNDAVTYSNLPLLTTLIAAQDEPTVGAPTYGGFELSTQGETDGNFTDGPFIFTGTVHDDLYARTYGDVGPVPQDNWTSSTGGPWETQSNETTNPRWSLGAPPSAGADAIFNLSSSGGYTVNISTGVSTNKLTVLNDKVSIDLFALNSGLRAFSTLSVGVSPSTGPTQGSLTLTNSGLFFGDSGQPVIPIVQANGIAVGGNGGTGTLKVTALVYVYSNTDTSIGAGSSIALAAGANFSSNTLTIAGTTNAWTGKFDIGSSDIDLRTGSLPTVINQLKSGFANGSWNGQGITSAAARADSTHLTAVGVLLNNDGKGNPIFGSQTSSGSFNQIDTDPTTTSVLLRYTYYGDTNLDGVVDGSDYSRIDNGFLTHASGWYNGDFNYDGVVDGSDYTLIDNAFNMQNGPLSGNFIGLGHPKLSGITEVDPVSSIQYISATLDGTAIAKPIADRPGTQPLEDPTATVTDEIAANPATSAVPEPASLGLIALALPLLRRRSRRTRFTDAR